MDHDDLEQALSHEFPDLDEADREMLDRGIALGQDVLSAAGYELVRDEVPADRSDDSESDSAGGS